MDFIHDLVRRQTLEPNASENLFRGYITFCNHGPHLGMVFIDELLKGA